MTILPLPAGVNLMRVSKRAPSFAYTVEKLFYFQTFAHAYSIGSILELRGAFAQNGCCSGDRGWLLASRAAAQCCIQCISVDMCERCPSRGVRWSVAKVAGRCAAGARSRGARGVGAEETSQGLPSTNRSSSFLNEGEEIYPGYS